MYFRVVQDNKTSQAMITKFLPKGKKLVGGF